MRLVGLADLFIENFTSHVSRALKVEPHQLEAVNPRLITISMPAFGSGGSWDDRPALGTTIESICGVQSLTGYIGGPPRMQGTSWDPVVGLHAAFAALAALRRRRTTGLGEHIEVSHIEAGTQLVAGPLIEYGLSGKLSSRRGNTSTIWSPTGCYQTTGEDQWVTLSVRSDGEWDRAREVLDPTGQVLASEKFSLNSDRLEHRAELDQRISSLTITWDRKELCARMQAVRVPCAPVTSPVDLLSDPHLWSRDMLTSVERQHVGNHLHFQSPIRLLRKEPVLIRAAPTLGEHNRSVLCGKLGLDGEALARLEAERIIGVRPIK